MTEGRVVGEHFLIGEMIGRGGMGTVYQGVDQRTGEAVAIKALKPDLIAQDPDLVERFNREGEALRLLNHPNIVKMLGAVVDGEEHFLIIEYVGGGSLRDLLEENTRLPIPRVLEIALDLADALTRAHRLKIIHRDIKPANVLLAEDGTPRLTDFGVAHLGNATRMTQTGSVIGTLAYLSPEACMGLELDPRADIWAFGVMLFEMLTGRRPFEATNSAALLNAILSAPTPDLLELCPETPPLLVALINRMLEKDRDQRIPSVRRVGAELEALITGADSSTLDSDLPDVIVEKPAGSRFATPTPPNITEDQAAVAGESAPPSKSTSSARPITQPDWNVQSVRRIPSQPRIFISYRRADSGAITGRIHDRLVKEYGEQHIFKDVDDIPLGSDFRRVLEKEVDACDVQLVIIGSNWLTIPDETGQRRLDNPDDFVRIEVETGLGRENVLVIPVLVDNAVMPTGDQLPGQLKELAYRNGATVRNDPDFNRDIQWLINQINNSFEIVRPLPTRLVFAVALLVIVGLVIGLGLVLSQSGPATPAADTVQIEPVAADEFMVLVTQMEAIGDVERDVQRFIVTDLKQHFEDIPFSKIRVRSYPAIMESAEQARAVAEQVNALVIVWGNVDANRVEAMVQLGSLEPYSDLLFSRDAVEQIVNARVQMTSERDQTLAYSVVAVVNGVMTFEGDVFELARNVAVLEEVDMPGAEIMGKSLGAYFHRYIQNFVNNIDQSQVAMGEAIQLDARNPVLFAARGLAYQRMGEIDQTVEDTLTAQRLGPEGWTTPLWNLANDAFFFRNDMDAARTYLDAIIARQPDDWFVYTLRGISYYLQADYEQARADIEQAIALDAEANFPYLFAIALALREGRFVEAQALFDTVLHEFPDPSFGERLTTATISDAAAQGFFFPAMSAFGNMTLRQWSAMIDDVDRALASDAPLSDLYFMKGFAYCNLGDDAAAEAAYTAGIERAPDYPLLYALRAEVRRNLGDLLGAAADARAVMQSDRAELFAPLMEASLAGDITCKNFFDVDLETLLAATPTP